VQISFCHTVARHAFVCTVICTCKTSNAFLVSVFMELSEADLLHRNPASAGTCCDTFRFSGTVQGTVCYGVMGCVGKWRFITGGKGLPHSLL
jgi:hypothetical protein